MYCAAEVCSDRQIAALLLLYLVDDYVILCTCIFLLFQAETRVSMFFMEIPVQLGVAGRGIPLKTSHLAQVRLCGMFLPQ